MNLQEKEEKQRLIGKYIDYVEVDKKGNKLEIIKYNFRDIFFIQELENINNFKLPMPNDLFVDDIGASIPLDYEMKTREDAKAYFDKLCNMLGKDYPLYYYEAVSDKDLKFNYKVNKDLEKIIKVTLLKEKENKDRLCISLISVDLSNVKIENDKIAYKKIFDELRKSNDVLT